MRFLTLPGMHWSVDCCLSLLYTKSHIVVGFHSSKRHCRHLQSPRGWYVSQHLVNHQPRHLQHRPSEPQDAFIQSTAEEEPLIHLKVCQPDNSACLIFTPSRGIDCVKGGPHTYYTLAGNIIHHIALEFKLTVDSLLLTARGSKNDADTVLDAGNFLQPPLCSLTRCSFHAYTFLSKVTIISWIGMCA